MAFMRKKTAIVLMFLLFNTAALINGAHASVEGEIVCSENLINSDVFSSNEVYAYTSKDKKDNTISEATHQFSRNSSDEIIAAVRWQFTKTGISGVEKSLLAENYSTKCSHIVVEGEGTEYTVLRQGNEVRLSGVYQRQNIDKFLKIDKNPFYTNPTIGLIGFLQSEKKKSRFWLLRPDEPKVILMQAQNLGVEIIDIGGRSKKAIKVKWGLTGLRALFFQEIYWFSPKTILFLKNVNREGTKTEIISVPEE